MEFVPRCLDKQQLPDLPSQTRSIRFPFLGSTTISCEQPEHFHLVSIKTHGEPYLKSLCAYSGVSY